MALIKVILCIAAWAMILISLSILLACAHIYISYKIKEIYLLSQGFKKKRHKIYLFNIYTKTENERSITFWGYDLDGYSLKDIKAKIDEARTAQAT